MEWDIIQDKLAELEEAITEHCQKVGAQELGLDYRCGQVFVGQGYLATHNPRQLEYYGGFEYIDRAFVTTVGSLTLYAQEAERVHTCLDHYAGVEN